MRRENKYQYFKVLQFKSSHPSGYWEDIEELETDSTYYAPKEKRIEFRYNVSESRKAYQGTGTLRVIKRRVKK